MLKSMFSAVSGLKSHQTMLDVIANNIANVNTNGFKSSRVTFTDIYYQTLASATEPSTASGGTNPTQIGNGVTVATVDVLNTRSGYQQTYRTLDMYISGDGYFVVQDGAGNTSYTRLGNFTFDVDGNLVDGNGNYVCGESPTLGSPVGTVGKITVANFNNYSSVAIGSDGQITGVNNTTGSVENLGQIALAAFPNADGLSQLGTSYLQETANSGSPTLYEAGSSAVGALVSGGLEMSNVDLSSEFTNMIIAQRGFQANSRVITTSDEILQELVNLKR
jgi:flagellar hook protein FlgE